MKNISIVIPTTDRALNFKECIASIYAQDYEGGIEVLIIENNSKDMGVISSILRESNVDKNIEKLSITHHYLKECKNANVARNYGAKIATGEIVFFFDSDDEMFPNHIKSRVKFFEGSDLKAVYGGSVIDKGNRTKEIESFQIKSSSIKSGVEFLFKEKGFAQTSSYAVSKKLTEVVKWDEDLNRNQDYDYFIRINEVTRWEWNSLITYKINWQSGVKRNHNVDSNIVFYELYKNYMGSIGQLNYLSVLLLETSAFSDNTYSKVLSIKTTERQLLPNFDVVLHYILRVKMLARLCWFLREYVKR